MSSDGVKKVVLNVRGHQPGKVMCAPDGCVMPPCVSARSEQKIGQHYDEVNEIWWHTIFLKQPLVELDESCYMYSLIHDRP